MLEPINWDDDLNNKKFHKVINRINDIIFYLNEKENVGKSKDSFPTLEQTKTSVSRLMWNSHKPNDSTSIIELTYNFIKEKTVNSFNCPPFCSSCRKVHKPENGCEK